jgi:hypothetical protein
MSDSPSGTTDSPAPAVAPANTPVTSSRDVAPTAETGNVSRGGDAADSTASAGRSSAEAPSLIAEATLEPPRVPGPRPETGNTAPTLAEATIPPAPLPSATSITTEGSASHGSDTSSSDHPGDGRSIFTVTAPQKSARPVAEATYIPPPVHDLGAQGADRAGTGGRSESDTPATSTSDAAIHAHNDAVGDTGAAESPGAHAVDNAAMPGTAATTGLQPISDTVIVAPTDRNNGAGQNAVPESGDSNARWSEGPDLTGSTPCEIGTASPEPLHENAGNSDRPADGLDTTGGAGATTGPGRETPNEFLAAGQVSDAVPQALASGDTEAGTLSGHDSIGSSVDGRSTASQPHDSEASGSGMDQSTDGGLPGGQDAGDTDRVQRYSAADLGARVGTGSDTNHTLYEGPDGKWHAIGDEVGRGLHRDKTGRLRDAKGYVNDDNKLPSKDIDAHAERGQPLDRMPVPTDPDQLAQVAALDAATRDRTEKQAAKAEIWATQVEPLADTLRQAGLSVDRNTFASTNFRYEFTRVAPTLPRDVRTAATRAVKEYARASRDLVEASETLGVAGGKLAASLLYPKGQTITSSDGTRGVKDTFDRTVYDGSTAPMLIIIEEKGAGSTLGVRRVPDLDNPGERIIAQQCSPEYVHDLLKNDATMAATLQADPQLYRDVQDTIQGSNGGAVECLLVHTSADSVVNVVPYLLDPRRFQREAIQMPSDEGAR